MSFPKKDEFIIFLQGTIPQGKYQAGAEFDFKIEQSKEFYELLFARGIHKIAFNCYAYKFGQHEALQNRFNNLRQYVRYAKFDELWTYGVKVPNSDRNRHMAELHDKNFGLFLGLPLLTLDFFVSLTGWRNEIESEVIKDGYCIISRKGQWKASSLLGLQE